MTYTLYCPCSGPETLLTDTSGFLDTMLLSEHKACAQKQVSYNKKYQISGILYQICRHQEASINIWETMGSREEVGCNGLGGGLSSVCFKTVTPLMFKLFCLGKTSTFLKYDFVFDVFFRAILLFFMMVHAECGSKHCTSSPHSAVKATDRDSQFIVERGSRLIQVKGKYWVRQTKL